MEEHFLEVEGDSLEEVVEEIVMDLQQRPQVLATLVHQMVEDFLEVEEDSLEVVVEEIAMVLQQQHSVLDILGLQVELAVPVEAMELLLLPQVLVSLLPPDPAPAPTLHPPHLQALPTVHPLMLEGDMEHHRVVEEVVASYPHL